MDPDEILERKPGPERSRPIRTSALAPGADGWVGSDRIRALLWFSKNQERMFRESVEQTGGQEELETRSRSRGEKRKKAHMMAMAYATHFVDLIKLEMQSEDDVIRDRLMNYTPQQLAKGGHAIFYLNANVLKERFYKDFLVRFHRPPPARLRRPKGEDAALETADDEQEEFDQELRGRDAATSSSSPTWAEQLPILRLNVGDSVMVTEGVENPLLSEAACALEGIVVRKTEYFIELAMPIPPDARTGIQFRIDQFMNMIPYERMVLAVSKLTNPAQEAAQGTKRVRLSDSVQPPLDGELRRLLLGSFSTALEAMDSSAESAEKVMEDWLRFREGNRKKDNDDEQELLDPGSYKWMELANAKLKTRLSEKKAFRKIQQALLDGTICIGDRNTTAGGEQVALQPFNRVQVEVILKSLKQRLTLVQGPPGTGKTRTAGGILCALSKLFGDRTDEKVLATAWSNGAADNIAETAHSMGLKVVRVGQPAKVRPQLLNLTVDSLLDSNPEVRKARHGLDLAGRKFADSQVGLQTKSEYDKAKHLVLSVERKATWRILKDADVVVSTCIGAMSDNLLSYSVVNGSAVPESEEPLRFRTVVIDEASQCCEPGALVPLLVGAEQLILIGDQNQLPPTVLSKEAARGGLGVSLFDRLLGLGFDANMLTHQYRMPRSLADFPSKRFYSGKLTTEVRRSHASEVEKPAILWPKASSGPIAFVDMSKPPLSDEVPVPQTLERIRAGAASYATEEAQGETPQTFKGSVENPWEAQEAVQIVLDWIRKGYPGSAIAIITPYTAQVRNIQTMLHRKASELEKRRRPKVSKSLEESEGGDEEDEKLRTQIVDVEVNTVDGFQGREKPFIVFSCVRSNSAARVGFLRDWRRLNVALTRSKEGLVVIGDPRTLKQDKNWSAYFGWCKNGGYVVTPGFLHRDVKEKS